MHPMIVKQPNRALMLFTLRGSVLPVILPKVSLIMAISTALAIVLHAHPHTYPEFSSVPFTLFGLALSIFLGFRNNACYDRWWEGRKLWGAVVVEMRTLARDVIAFLPAAHPGRTHVLNQCIAYAYLLKARLRDEEGLDEAGGYLSAQEHTTLLPMRNRPEAILRSIMEDVAEWGRQGLLSDITKMTLETRLHAIGAAQGGCERIVSTSTPFAYTLLLHRTAWIFCLLLPFGFVSTLGFATPLLTGVLAYTFFGLDALSDELEQPFGLHQNDLPLNAIVRGIEIDLLEAQGVQELPEALAPINGVLT
ncbi:putative membrane spanning protein [Granulibacter bethesdensis]|uniref:Membrane spanning protein n=2 Tax=Granulibacter bethesdensis TaxID=364410 RepID=A0AAN0VFM5_9PROT|nr:putative membrane spanning protein [Granulibacter bethesdensis]